MVRLTKIVLSKPTQWIVATFMIVPTFWLLIVEADLSFLTPKIPDLATGNIILFRQFSHDGIYQSVNYITASQNFILGMSEAASAIGFIVAFAIALACKKNSTEQ